MDAGRQGWELSWDTGHGCERGVDAVSSGLEGSGQQGVGVSAWRQQWDLGCGQERAAGPPRCLPRAWQSCLSTRRQLGPGSAA